MLNKILSYFGYSLDKIQDVPDNNDTCWIMLSINEEDELSIDLDYRGETGIQDLAELVFNMSRGALYSEICATVQNTANEENDPEALEAFVNITHAMLEAAQAELDIEDEDEPLVSPLEVLQNKNENVS